MSGPHSFPRLPHLPRLPRRQNGYILALNIVVLALMLVGATYIGQRMSLAVALAHAEQKRVDDDLALEAARAKVLFLLATVPRSKAGLGNTLQAVQLDGRPYRLGKNVLVSLQDTNGLIGINGLGLGTTRRSVLERLLSTYGTASVDSERLIDSLLDYRDSDDYRRINGAEREDYLAAGKGDLIRNDNLNTPDEAGRIMFWPETPAIWTEDDPITDQISVQRFASFNPNTANWRVLVAMTGISDQIARGLVERRRSGEIADISRLLFAGDIGNPFTSGGAISLIPSKSIVVTLRIEGASWGYRFLVTQTPVSDKNPWHIEYAHRVAFNSLLVSASAAIVPTLPELESLRDVSAKQRLQLPF